MRRSLWLILVPIVAAITTLAWSFTPAPLAAVAIDVDALPLAHPPVGMSVSALPTGTIGARAAFAFRGGSFGEERSFAQTPLLVRHPRGDLLFDAGLASDAPAHFARTSWLMRATSTMRPGKSAARQLREAGYDLGRLAGVVPTHAHWDHVSGLADFGAVPVWLNAEERAFVAEGGDATALMRSFAGIVEHAYTLRDGPYLGFARSFDVWGDGSVVLVGAPGHTPGSVLAFVTLPSGRRLVLLGDLVWQTDGITRRAERPWASRRMVDHDAEQVRSAIAHVAALHARFPQLVLLPAHDDRALSALPVFPARLE